MVQVLFLRIYVNWLLRVVFLGCIVCSRASAAIADDMDHRRWTGNGLGQSAVGALAQTPDGHLWLGTDDSLYRFDGFEFEEFAVADGKPLGVVSALLSTSKGLWVGFRAGGARLIDASGEMLGIESGFPDGVVYGLAEDQERQVWVAADEGLARYDGKVWRVIGQEAGFADRHARAVHVDEDGYLWAASEEELYMLPPGANRFMRTGIKSQSISQIASSDSGEIWVSDRLRDRLLHLTRTDSDRIEIEELSTSRASSIVLDDHGNAWLGTQGSGVHKLAAGTAYQSGDDSDRANSYTVRDGLSSDYVMTQLIDRDGTLWVGTDAGLDRLRRKTLSPLALPDAGVNHALAAGGDGSLWVGSENGQVLHLRGGSRSIFELEMPITALVNSEPHGLLIGGYRGVFSLVDDQPVRIAALPVESAPESAIRALIAAKDGAIWVSVNRAGLYVWADQQWRHIAPVSDSERQVMPVSASRDQAGKLWFGYRDNLLVSFDEQKIESWGEQEGLDIGHVTAMLHLPGRTWAGGQHGLAYLDNGRFHRLDLPVAESFQNIYALLAVPAEEGQGEYGMDIWVHSRGGIFKLPAAEIERVIAGGDTLLYSSHDPIGRLPMDPFRVLPLPTAVYAPGGALWFATGDGVVGVDPYRPQGMAQPPTVMIKSLTADGVDVDISAEPVRLSAAPQRMVIAYSALNLAAPENMRFQYRLEGHDPEWVDAGRAREATFPRLRPGEYEFQVRALDANGHLNLPDTALPIIVPQVFYLRPGFQLLFAGILLALMLWMVNMHTRREKAALRTRLEERFQERERIARELHDTLLQSVQGMMLSFQAVADTLPAGSRAGHAMNRALDRAEEVIAEGRDRITGLRGQIAPAEDLGVAFRNLQPEAGVPASAAYRVNTAGEPLPLRDAVRDAFYQIGREAVLNALRHAQATRITVTLTYASDTFEMAILDDGLGIAPIYQRLRGRPEHGGLRGMYERAERMAATLVIDSGAQGGTRISLSLPGPAAYASS